VQTLLHGVRILDVATFSPVRLGTTVLADLGADVIQIEKPAAAPDRATELLDSIEHPRWLWHSRNKRSVALDLKSPTGYGDFMALVATADIIIEGFAVGVAARLGVDFETVVRTKPDIIYASVTGYGQDGAESNTAGHEQNYQAASGLTSTTAVDGTAPSLTAYPVSDTVASLYAVIGVLAALERRRQTGAPAFLDVSIRDAALSLLGYSANYYWAGDVTDARDVREFGGHPGTGVYATADGRYVVISAVEPWAWERLCSALDLNELTGDYDKLGSEGLPARQTLAAAFRARTRDQWEQFNSDHNVGITAVTELPELLDDPEISRRGMVAWAEHPTQGRVRQLATPIRIDGHFPAVNSIPARGADTFASTSQVQS
jgi:crotonobetainyl-CoA:carnitine CoA-transferase CaiB-like acyl-CoA transferase